MSDEPIYIVRLKGFVRFGDMASFKERFEDQLDGKVIVIDDRVESIEQLSPSEKSRLVTLLASQLEEDE